MAVLAMLETRRRRGRRGCIVTFQGRYRTAAVVGTARAPSGFSPAASLTLVAADAVRGALRADLPRVRRIAKMEDRHVRAPATEIFLPSSLAA